jgi:hypothetical protein
MSYVTAKVTTNNHMPMKYIVEFGKNGIVQSSIRMLLDKILNMTGTYHVGLYFLSNSFLM